MIKDYFKIEKNPKKGLLALEWVMLAYMILTVATMLFTYTKLVNPESMIWGRIRVLVMTGALWGVYRMVPCRATKLVRVAAQMALLAWWYPDTYEINRMFPNLDHVFAGWEQQLFGCQPSLLFSKALPWAVVSELMDMGYFMYYPMIAAIVPGFASQAFCIALARAATSFKPSSKAIAPAATKAENSPRE